MQTTETKPKIRSLKKLYSIVLTALIEDTYMQYYICNIINNLKEDNMIGGLAKITDIESNIVLSHFERQRPTTHLYPEIYNDIVYQKDEASTAWFTTRFGATNEDMINIRVKLLQLIIKSL